MRDNGQDILAIRMKPMVTLANKEYSLDELKDLPATIQSAIKAKLGRLAKVMAEEIKDNMDNNTIADSIRYTLIEYFLGDYNAKDSSKDFRIV